MKNDDKCPKCGGAGWVWGYELDNPDEDTVNDSMTKYTCDHKWHGDKDERKISRD